MADVSPPSPAPGADPADADRGQLLLVTALALSVVLVALAVLLNTAIYTGNVATREAGPTTTEIVGYERAGAQLGRVAIEDVNYRNNSSYAELEAAYVEVVTAWSNASSRHGAVALADVHLSVTSMTEGTRIGQTQTANFTSDADNATWTVANESHVRAFRMNVSQPSLAGFDDDIDDLVSIDYFGVTFTDENGDAWTVYVHKDSGGSQVAVNVVDPAGNEVGDGCTADPGADDFAVVDVTNASLAGQACPELRFFGNLSGAYDVEYSRADAVNGTYSLVVDRPLTGALRTGADDDASTEPYATPAIYSADLRLTYRTSETYYRTQIRVAPGEPDA